MGAKKPGPLVDKSSLGRLHWMEEYADWVMDNGSKVGKLHFKRQALGLPKDASPSVVGVRWEALLGDMEEGHRRRAVKALNLATGE